MKLRKAKIEDAKILLEWRNDPLTRENSINADEILWENHLAWLSKTLNNPYRTLFIAEDDSGIPVGTIRTDKEGANTYELSWTIAPEYRGKGFGREMVVAILGENFLKNKKIRAQIRENNIPSIKIVKSLGFNLKTKDDDGLTEWVLSNREGAIIPL